MYEENAINYYEKNIDLKQVISDHNLQDADGAFFVCNLNDIRNKYDIWKKYMPRITPFYGKY